MGYAYGAALIVMGVLDAAWLGFLAGDLYRDGIGHLMAPSFNKLAAALFYFGYPAGLVLLALQPQPARISAAAWRSALVGLVAYGTYDLTNVATLRDFSPMVAMADMAWGTFASTLAGTAAYLARRRHSV
jgi:uncharacterized membrane protein